MWTDHLHRHTKYWDPEEIERMESSLRAGKSVPQIAAMLHRTQEAVRAKARLLDLLPKRASAPPLVRLESPNRGQSERQINMG